MGGMRGWVGRSGSGTLGVMERTRHANRLAGSTSPYLLQHAHNPVDWFPWGEEAFAKARSEDKPVLLSVGYAACHWCHVMERESFEDEGTAELMNRYFVSIKVDREERPDVDSIYMDAVQAMTGRGGWPLTAFLTPGGEPFYAGTYYPAEPRWGMPSFRQVLVGIAETWRERREDIRTQAARIVEAIGRAGSVGGSREPLTEEVAVRALASLRAAFDPEWGGFGGAPKFPQPMTLDFLLRRGVRGDADAHSIMTTTLDRMTAGGMYDQVTGGFARYSTDERWLVPHFEKMLYDNAQLAQLYTRAWLVGREPRRERIARETIGYLLAELRQPGGAFSSSQDADSEGVEGKFAVWTWDELVSVVGADAATAFGATPEGNWEGVNVLTAPEEDLPEARAALAAARAKRVPPPTDDKVVTAWNALAVTALAEAGRAFREPAFIDAAVACAEFLLSELRDDRGRVLRSWRAGTPGGPGYADDYALLAEACLLLYQTTFELRWFEEARWLSDELIRLFHDPERGGFFTTGTDAETLVVRPKDLYDNAVPSGNSVAADVLLRLSLLTGDAEYERIGLSALRLVRDGMADAPTGFGRALSALELYLGPSREVAIIGDPDDPRTRFMIDEVAGRFLPSVVLAVARPDDDASRRAVPLLESRPQRDGLPTAYVCERFVCKLPVTEPDGLAALLELHSVP